jgi:hypothetical protein
MCAIGRQSYVWRIEAEEATYSCDAQRGTPLRLRVCAHEVTQPLDLREVEPVALVRAARKLARSGEATSWDAPERG